jgi:hypothetical protein
MQQCKQCKKRNAYIQCAKCNETVCIKCRDPTIHMCEDTNNIENKRIEDYKNKMYKNKTISEKIQKI